MKKTIITATIAFLSLCIQAQNSNNSYSKGGTSLQNAITSATSVGQNRCNTSQVMEAIRSQDPIAYDMQKAQKEQELQNWITNNYAAYNAQRAVITIPVVVQIWENTSTVSDNNVYEQIAILNEDFRRLNSDASNTPSVFSSIVADCEIEFCLASFDPQGNLTSGIVRKTVGGSPAGQGGNDLWDSNKYLNIFVYGIGGGTLGYTYLASQAPNNAVHIGSNYFGSSGQSAPFNLGRTATHEVGHWLNLEHIWGDSNCGNDFCNDTPTQQSENYNCPSHPSASCGNSGDMFMNYMDYVNDNCMNSFSADQKARMIAAINTYRSGLLTSSSAACGTAALTADFSANQTTVSVGTSINFTDLSSGGATTWAWTFNGAATTSSNNQNPANIVYNTVGCFEVQLAVTDGGSGSDNETKTCYINVTAAISGCDSLNYPLSGTMGLLGSGGWGYVSGDNDYGDLSKSNFYDNYSPYTQIDGVMMNFGKAYSASGSSSINIAVWDNSGAAGTPGSIIASQSVAVNSITEGIYTTFMFSSPVTITGDFYLGIELSGSAGDTVAIQHNADGETNPGIAWEEWSDGSWHNYSETPASWGINIEHAVHPIVCSSGGGNSLSTATSSANETCGNENGFASVTASGGSGSYTYSWSNGGNNSSINNVPGGTYTVTVSDGLDTQIVTIVVGANNTAMAAAGSSTDETCGQLDGSASVTTSGATGTVNYIWSNGSAGASISNISAGTYSVTLTDGTGCSIVESIQVSSSGGFTATVASTDVGCVGDATGTATINPAGASGTVTYVWNNGALGASLTGLAAGTYSYTATDAGGCVYSESIIISEPSSALVVTSTSTDATCADNDGTATVIASGGVGSYSYLWNNGTSSFTLSNAASGNYSCTISDTNGCLNVESIVIGSSSVPIAISSASTNEDCGQNNGTASITAIGGTGALSYMWSNGQSASIAVNLGSGNFSCTVTDAAGCSEVEIVTVNNNSGFSASVAPVDLNCNGDENGVAIASGTGGVPPYNFLWTSGAATSAITGLSGGTYQVTVTDMTGCSFTAIAEVYEPSSIAINGNVSDVTNNGAANGSINVVGIGGTGSFTYVWSNGQTGSNASNLVAGNYSVTATDDNGCNNTASFTVGQPLEISDSNSDLNIKIFPNPVRGVLNINIESQSSDEIDINVLNSIGQIIWSKNEVITSGENIFTVDLSNNLTGVYFISFRGANISATERVILN